MTTSRRRIGPLAGLLVLVAAGLWWSGRPGPTERARASDPPPPGVSAPRSATVPAPPPSRRRVSTPSEPSEAGPGVPAGEGIEVVVHEAGSERGAARVDLFFADVTLLGGDGSDFDGQTVRHGLRYRTDEQGLARVPVPRGEFRLIAVAEGRRGSTNRCDLEARRAVIELRDDPTLVVRVLSASGSPATELPVALVSQGAGGRAWIHETVATDGEGIARLHPGRCASRQLFARALVEDPEPVELALEAQRGGPGPVLTLPPCGRLEVALVAEDGVLEPRGLSARIEFVETDAVLGLENGRGSGLSGGRVTFPFVRADEAFVVRVGQHVSAPLSLRAGEVRGLFLHEPVAGMRAVARLLGPGGEVLRDTLVRRWEARDDLRPAPASFPGEMIRSDAEGRVAWESRDRAASGTVRLRLVTADRFRPVLWGELAFRSTPGLVDLGEVPLEPTPLLVGGVVVDPHGEPVAQADVTCGLVTAGAPPVWRPDLTDVTDAGGRFAIHAAPFAGALLLAVDRPGHLAVRDLAVAVGTPDLVIELEPGHRHGSLTGSVRRGEAPESRLQVRLGARARRGGGYFPGQWNARGPSAFEIPLLPPGDYDVELSWDLGGSSRVLTRVGPLRVEAGEPTMDPRLAFDTSALVKDVEVEVVGPTGASVSELFVSLLEVSGAPGEPGSLLGTEHLVSERGGYRFGVPLGPIELELRSAGLSPWRGPAHGVPMRIGLEPGVPVQLRARGAESGAWPAGPIEVALQPVDTFRRYTDPGYRPWNAGGVELRVSEPGSYVCVFRVPVSGEAQPRIVLGEAIEVPGDRREPFELGLPPGLR